LNNFKPDPTNSAVNKAVFDFAVQALLKSVKVEFPFLNFLVLSQIFDRLIFAITNPLFNYLQKIATFTVISTDIQKQLSNYNKSLDEYKVAIEEKNHEKIKASQANMEKAMDDLLDWSK
jgi:hypothetical protein